MLLIIMIVQDYKKQFDFSFPKFWLPHSRYFKGLLSS